MKSVEQRQDLAIDADGRALRQASPSPTPALARGAAIAPRA
jgi:hypothetical protein